MNWFYSLGNEQNGPITETQLDELIRSGKINRETLVWREGMSDWQPLGAVRTIGVPSLPGANSGQTCVECGKTFAASDLIKINQSSVCANCKPIFLQRLSEGVAVPGSAGLWRAGKKIVTVAETTFPDRCIKCNAPTNGYHLKRVLYWHHPAYYLLLLCNLLILIIVVLIVRKKAIVHIGVCEKHRAQRKMDLIIGWSGALGGIVMLFASIVMESGWVALAGGVVLLFGLIWGGVRAPLVTASKITKQNVWISGAKREFLDTLPEWPGL